MAVEYLHDAHVWIQLSCTGHQQRKEEKQITDVLYESYVSTVAEQQEQIPRVGPRPKGYLHHLLMTW
jgi:hypothetical protein